jgi:GT2 family glycosyltransferase
MFQPVISIIIINYNTFNLTLNCIKSILAIETELSYEIILVDNNSSERNPDEFLAEVPGIRLIKNIFNAGFAKGNNLGIEQSRGEYILLLNSDTILLNKAITIAYQFLDSHPKVAAATVRLEYPDGKVQHNCQRFPSAYYKSFELLRIQKLLPQLKWKLLGSFFDHDQMIYPDWIWGTFFMFKKGVLDFLPGRRLADDFFMYGEDIQWCLEFEKLGKKVAFIPQGRVVHFLGESGGARNEWINKNQEILMSKYYSFVHRKVIAWLDVLLRITIR